MLKLLIHQYIKDDTRLTGGEADFIQKMLYGIYKLDKFLYQSRKKKI